MNLLFTTANDADRQEQTQRTAEELLRMAQSPQVPRQGDIMATLTSYSTGKYAWSQQGLDASGARYTLSNGLSGTTSYMPAVALSRTQTITTLPAPVWLRPTSIAGTAGIYWEILEYEPPTTTLPYDYKTFEMSSAFTSTAENTWTEITQFTSLQFPTTGVWAVDFNVYGWIGAYQSNGYEVQGRLYFRAVRESGIASFLVPNATSAGMYCNCCVTNQIGPSSKIPPSNTTIGGPEGAGEYHYFATGQGCIHTLVNVTTINTKALKLEALCNVTPFTNSTTYKWGVYYLNSTSTSNGYYEPDYSSELGGTWIRAIKVSS